MIHPAIEDHPGFIRRYDYAPRPDAARQYNPSLVRLPAGGAVMAWRIQDCRGVSRIVAAKVSGKRWQLGRESAIDIPAPKGTHTEDPRLVVVGGRLILLVAQVNYSTRVTFCLRGFELDPETFATIREIPLPFGKNGRGAHEKNWMPFENSRGELSFVHQVAPEHVVIDTDTGKSHRSPGLRSWRWGTASGRTPAVAIDSAALPPALRPAASTAFLCFTGGHQAHPRRKSEYWLGAFVFSAEAPHAIIAVSPQPLLWASERTPAVLNPFDPGWNPVCVFPGGLIVEGGEAIVSLGLNDSFCALMRWPLAELLASLIPLAQLPVRDPILAPSGRPAPVGNIRVRSLSRQPLGEHGGPFRFGDEWFTSEDRVEALGSKVEVLL